MGNNSTKKNKNNNNNNNNNDIDNDNNNNEVTTKTNDNFDHLWKFCVLGDPNVGKTSLSLRYIEDRFSAQKIKLEKDFLEKMVTYNGDKIRLQVWDTQGQETFRQITGGYLKSAHAVLLVYDISSEESYQTAIKKWNDIVLKTVKTAKRILLGNKLDLSERKVKTETAKQWAAEAGIPFMETSALSNMNVAAAFETMIDEILKSEKNNN